MPSPLLILDTDPPLRALALQVPFITNTFNISNRIRKLETVRIRFHKSGKFGIFQKGSLNILKKYLLFRQKDTTIGGTDLYVSKTNEIKFTSLDMAIPLDCGFPFRTETRLAP